MNIKVADIHDWVRRLFQPALTTLIKTMDGLENQQQPLLGLQDGASASITERFSLV